MHSVFLISGTLVLLLLSGCGEHAEKQDASQQTEARFGDYKVTVSESYESESMGGDLSRVEIFKGQASLYSMSGHRFSIGTHFDFDEMTNSAPIGTDITGDGQPNLVISEHTGGHCGQSLHIFEIGRIFGMIQIIELGPSYSDFENLDEDPALELPITDCTFAYWNTSYAASPAPEVILKYSEGRYQMAPNLMKKLPQHQVELYETAAKIGSLPDWTVASTSWEFSDGKRVPTELWGEMLNLIYSGNMAQAWKLFDLAWPEGFAGKQEFLEEFKAQLATSPFWEQIRDMNQNRSVK